MDKHDAVRLKGRACVTNLPVGSTWINITANLCIPAQSTLCGLRLCSKGSVLLGQ